MPLVEICFKEEVCFACQSSCLGGPTYACAECKYFLHKRCVECPTECSQCKWNVCIECYLLPKHISFVLHSHHDQPQPQDLTLSIMSIKTHTKFTCLLCHTTFKSSSHRFECAACGFVVDVECALTPPVTRDGQGYFQHFNHPHAMYLVEIDSGDEICFACNLSIKTRERMVVASSFGVLRVITALRGHHRDVELKTGRINGVENEKRENASIGNKFRDIIESVMLNLEVVNVEGYMILRYLARILERLNTEFMSCHLKDVARAFVGLQATAERNGTQINSIQTDDILKLQRELHVLKVRSYDHFVNRGEFLMESLSMALKLMDRDHVSVQALHD
ncbi:hypothetical protein TIFTF001_003403 [Ficus carica]|uniref:Phorbol-ester/DAG-type domain-containing protein n=1 Tax=Ficus carica TaxID=3494 RepID=A0AA87ZEU9_FICCA|nr:hypothetical protein TIFTF001_003403 [Ficus carica]